VVQEFNAGYEIYEQDRKRQARTSSARRLTRMSFERSSPSACEADIFHASLSRVRHPPPKAGGVMRAKTLTAVVSWKLDRLRATCPFSTSPRYEVAKLPIPCHFKSRLRTQSDHRFILSIAVLFPWSRSELNPRRSTDQISSYLLGIPVSIALRRTSTNQHGRIPPGRFPAPRDDTRSCRIQLDVPPTYGRIRARVPSTSRYGLCTHASVRSTAGHASDGSEKYSTVCYSASA
jgi:hypothetical protein